jgi:hypothetical protein
MSPIGPLFLLVVVLATDVWVYRDALTHERRGRPVEVSFGSLQVDTPTAWLLGCLVLWVIFLPLYLTARRNT